MILTLFAAEAANSARLFDILNRQSDDCRFFSGGIRQGRMKREEPAQKSVAYDIKIPKNAKFVFTFFSLYGNMYEVKIGNYRNSALRNVFPVSGFYFRVFTNLPAEGEPCWSKNKRIPHRYLHF